MNYYRSFERLVGILGVITLALIAAIVFFASRMAQPVVEPVEEPAQEFDPPWASPQAPAESGLDPDALAPLKEAVPVAPQRSRSNAWLIQDEPEIDTRPDFTEPSATVEEPRRDEDAKSLIRRDTQAP
ncbi:MAG: hypothetical protein JSV45_06430 [Chromatiales bacterium]|nr:MAG: hypothetical protein JSV45_06430 [Chromatiales bacterium]